jgi:hypothetical protein
MGASGYIVIYVRRLFFKITAKLIAEKYCNPVANRLYYDHAVATATLQEIKNMRISENTKTHKLFTALQAGEKVSPGQAQKRFGIKNMSAEVSRIRQSGFAVYANRRVAGNNVPVTEYRIGKPSRALIAAGYRAMSLGL